ncbi:MAG: LCP family protein [Acidobacteria bacterium]|nr:LCP family protein [Acidobacteriota bacterium]
MKTTLKRGIGRGAALNGNGRSILPPGPRAPMTRYRQPEPPRRGPGALIRLVALWTVLAALIVAGGAAGAAYLRAHRFVEAVAPKTKQDKAAAKELDVAIPGQPTTALVIGTDKRRGREAADTGRSDTLMLVRADPRTDSLSMLSFPRDLIVTVKCPGHADVRDRINAAFSDCGTVGSVDTVRALTGVPINYFVTVNFRGFLQLVDHLGGVWVDVDHRYFNNQTGPGGYSAINLWPGYQRLRGYDALAYVRYRHFDSDLYRVARQQLFLKALKQQIKTQLDLQTLLDIVDAIEKNVIIGRGGNKALDLKTLKDYIYFAQNLQGGHIFQSRIEGLTGYAELSTDPSNITAAVRDFVQPDVAAPAKARDAALGIRRRTSALRPAHISVSVLNGNGVQGSAANAAYALGQRGYKIVLPPSGRPVNAPTSDYFRTTVLYDATQKRSHAAAQQLANGAMTTVVVGANFHGTLAPAPVDKTPQRQPAAVVPNAAATLPYLRSLRRRVPFKLEVPRLIERSSRPEPLAPVRLYRPVRDHRAVRLTFQTGANEFWGIQETDWPDAPLLADPNFSQTIRGRHYDFYFSGPHLHMVVLKENGATYWVINTILDTLSNETMIAIAKGLAPVGR